MPDAERTHISHDEILALCREVSAQGAMVAGLTRALEERNGKLDKIVEAQHEALREMAAERDLQTTRCNQRFRAVEKQVFPGIQHYSKRFWAGVALLITGINLLMTLVFRLIQ